MPDEYAVLVLVLEEGTAMVLADGSLITDLAAFHRTGGSSANVVEAASIAYQADLAEYEEAVIRNEQLVQDADARALAGWKEHGDLSRPQPGIDYHVFTPPPSAPPNPLDYDPEGPRRLESLMNRARAGARH